MVCSSAWKEADWRSTFIQILRVMLIFCLHVKSQQVFYYYSKEFFFLSESLFELAHTYSITKKKNHKQMTCSNRCYHFIRLLLCCEVCSYYCCVCQTIQTKLLAIIIDVTKSGIYMQFSFLLAFAGSFCAIVNLIQSVKSLA